MQILNVNRIKFSEDMVIRGVVHRPNVFHARMAGGRHHKGQHGRQHEDGAVEDHMEHARDVAGPHRVHERNRRKEQQRLGETLIRSASMQRVRSNVWL